MGMNPVESLSSVARTTRSTELSVVIPFFNEAPNIVPLLTELRATLDQLGIDYEVLAVDDGSKDGTAAVIAGVAASWPALQLVELPENCGQATALWRGFCDARGAWILSLDGDRQNPPYELTKLWVVRDSADLITGRRARREDSWLRRTMSRVANGVRRRLLRDGVDDSGCALRLFRREVVGSFLPIRTLYSFLPAFAASHGWRVRQLDVEHRPRLAGQSNYGLIVMSWRPLVDMLALRWLLRRRLPRG